MLNTVYQTAKCSPEKLLTAHFEREKKLKLLFYRYAWTDVFYVDNVLESIDSSADSIKLSRQIEKTTLLTSKRNTRVFNRVFNRGTQFQWKTTYICLGENFGRFASLCGVLTPVNLSKQVHSTLRDKYNAQCEIEKWKPWFDGQRIEWP